MLDTTVLVDLSRRAGSINHRRANDTVSSLVVSGDVLFTSRINEAEFRVGAFRANSPKNEADRIESLLSILVILEFDAVAALRYAETQSHLLDIGKPSGEADVFIAAIAIANGQRLVTRNPRHFAHIPELAIIAY